MDSNEKRFADLGALREAIAEDVKAVRERLTRPASPCRARPGIRVREDSLGGVVKYFTIWPRGQLADVPGTRPGASWPNGRREGTANRYLGLTLRLRA